MEEYDPMLLFNYFEEHEEQPMIAFDLLNGYGAKSCVRDLYLTISSKEDESYETFIESPWIEIILD